MYVLRAKVTIEEELNHIALGVTGSPGSIFDGSGIYDLNSSFHRNFVVLTNDAAKELLESCAVPHYSADLWRWLDIRAGIPAVYADTTETFIPQTINLDLVDGISFKKGCFPGQEIIARIKYLGKPKQRMIIAAVESDAVISAGTEIFSSSGSQQKSGMVVDSIRTSENRFELSAQISTTVINEGTLSANSAKGPVLNRLELPYSLPE
jgi:folate-binding protein YgfZ